MPVLSDHSDQFAARLRKNAKARRKWAEQNQVFAFRLYDADLPDYAVAIDLFLASEEVRTTHIERTFDVPYLLISEYQAPKSIDPHKAYRRFEDAVRIAAAVLEIPRDQVFTRVRKQAKGGGQYARGRTLPKPVLTQESGLTFELDLASYLDVGLFLDHRITRRFIATQAKGKDVLNLFAYTGSASVYAAAGGAKEREYGRPFPDVSRLGEAQYGAQWLYGVCVSFHQGRRARVGTCGKGSAPGEGRSHSSLRSYLRRPTHLL